MKTIKNSPKVIANIQIVRSQLAMLAEASGGKEAIHPILDNASLLPFLTAQFVSNGRVQLRSGNSVITPRWTENPHSNAGDKVLLQIFDDNTSKLVMIPEPDSRIPRRIREVLYNTVIPTTNLGQTGNRVQLRKGELFRWFGKDKPFISKPDENGTRLITGGEILVIYKKRADKTADADKIRIQAIVSRGKCSAEALDAFEEAMQIFQVAQTTAFDHVLKPVEKAKVVTAKPVTKTARALSMKTAPAVKKTSKPKAVAKPVAKTGSTRKPFLKTTEIVVEKAQVTRKITVQPVPVKAPHLETPINNPFAALSNLVTSS